MLNQTRTYGIEIELISRLRAVDLRFEIEAALAPFGHTVNTSCYHHNTDGLNTTHWELKPDASIRSTTSHPYGIEVVSPVLKGDDGLAVLKAVTSVLDRHCTVNRSCGLHVHHKIDHTEIDRVSSNWFYAEDLIMKCLPPSRQNNRFCQTWNTHDSLSAAKNLATCNRYHTLNLASFALRGTAEFRAHSGTLEFEKIKNWAVITQSLVETTIEPWHYTNLHFLLADIKCHLPQTATTSVVNAPLADGIYSRNFGNADFTTFAAFDGCLKNAPNHVKKLRAKLGKQLEAQLITYEVKTVQADGYFFTFQKQVGPKSEWMQIVDINPVASSADNGKFDEAAEWLENRLYHFQHENTYRAVA